MPLVLEFFPPEVIELNKELQNHPILTSILTPSMTLEEKLGHVAAYCNVVIDDYFLEEEIQTLIWLLLARLKKKSMVVVE